jgi:hypothetical protein
VTTSVRWVGGGGGPPGGGAGQADGLGLPGVAVPPPQAASNRHRTQPGVERMGDVLTRRWMPVQVLVERRGDPTAVIPVRPDCGSVPASQLIDQNLWCPRSESNRHAFKGGGFSYHFGFRGPEQQYRSGSWSGARLHHSLLGSRCPPSALYTFLRACEGLARHQLEQELLRAFTEFDGLHPEDFSARAQVGRLSPLRLPIPPLGHRVRRGSIGFRKRERYGKAVRRRDLLSTSRI